MTRYPENTSISVEDFENCDWQAALTDTSREDYSSMWQALSSAAKDFFENGQPTKGRVLRLLADCCSMMLKPESLNEPFQAIVVMQDKRSALPDDFLPDEIALFSEIYPNISDFKLCARISDLAWLLTTPRDINAALMSIDSYCKTPVNTESWIRDGSECWDRAISLCLMLGAGAGERLREIEKTLVEELQNASELDGFLAFWISELLAKHKLFNDEQRVIAEKLEMLAREFNQSGDLHRARDYFDAAGEWHKRLGDEPKYCDMIVLCAEGWVKEAASRLAIDKAGHLAAASFYENAIQKYRTIPRARRETYNVNTRISQIQKDMNEAGELSLNDMGVITSEPIDITALIDHARTLVIGKSAVEAMLALANVYRGARVEEIREFTKKLSSKYPLQALFSATHLSRDGRVIAKQAGNGFDGDDETAIWPEVVKNYVMELGIVVPGQIWPALEVVRQEHRLRESDFLGLTRQSSAIPPNGEALIAKGLFLGYDNDFVAALHILVPQLENLVRYHLKQHGVKTTNLDSNGIENENGLSTLMMKCEVKEIFGEDLAFELSALFCDSFGPNLRNELAHGLVGYEASQSIYSIYAWWLMLRITFNTFWKAQQTAKDPITQSDVQEN